MGNWRDENETREKLHTDASIATFRRDAPPFPGGLLKPVVPLRARFQLELGRDRVYSYFTRRGPLITNLAE